MPPGGEDKRFTEFPSHLQCHQWDSDKHSGSRGEQLVLSSVISPHGLHVGTCFVICKLRMTSRANHWARARHGKTEHKEKSGEWKRKENKELCYFIDFLRSHKRAHIFLNLTGNTQSFHYVLTEVCGRHS